MKFKKQILEFFIKTNDEINQMKESHNDDLLKEFFVCALINFKENNKEISQMKFKRGKEINLNSTDSINDAICLAEIQKSIEKIPNIRSWLENFVSSLREDDYNEPELDNLFESYASSANIYFKGKDTIASSIIPIKKYLKDLGFGSDKKDLFIQNFPKKDFLEKFFPFKSEFLKNLCQDNGQSIWKQLNGDVVPISRREVEKLDGDDDEDDDGDDIVVLHLLPEDDIKKKIKILENDSNNTLKKCSLFFHRVRKSFRNRRDYYYENLLKNIFSDNESESASHNGQGNSIPKDKEKEKRKEKGKKKKANNSSGRRLKRNKNFSSVEDEELIIGEEETWRGSSSKGNHSSSNMNNSSSKLDAIKIKNAFDEPIKEYTLFKNDTLNVSIKVDNKTLKMNLMYKTLKQLIFDRDIKVPDHILFVVGDPALNEYLLTAIGYGGVNDKFKKIKSLTILANFSDESLLNSYKDYCLSLLNIHKIENTPKFKLLSIIRQDYGKTGTKHLVINLYFVIR
jgi:hypothetical protein